MSLIPEDLAPFACTVMKNSIEIAIPKNLIWKLLKSANQSGSPNLKNTTNDFLSSTACQINKIAFQRLKKHLKIAPYYSSQQNS